MHVKFNSTQVIKYNTVCCC